MTEGEALRAPVSGTPRRSRRPGGLRSMTVNRSTLADLERGTPFEQRHIGPDAAARAKMLPHIGYGSLDELTAAAVPDVIKNAEALDLPVARTEAEVLAELRSL